MTTGFLVFKIAVLGGWLVTLVVVAGLVRRIRILPAVREFSQQRRPEDLAEYPSVTIIVPARNEERNIAACLESLLALDYPTYDVLVVDDHSADGTAQIVEEFMKRKTRLPVIKLLSLKEDPGLNNKTWICPKSRALWRGAEEARGDWILFIDADTRQKSETLWRAMDLARRHGLKALSMTGDNINPGFWGDLLEAVVNPGIFLAIPWGRVNDPRDSAAWMNGNFILYERSAYFKVGGHRAVAGFIQDDLALALHSKAAGVPFYFLPVSSAYECHDYVGLQEAFRGWTRRLAAGGARLRMSHSSYFVQALALFVLGIWPVVATAGALLTHSGQTLLGVPLSLWALGQFGLVVILQAILRSIMKMPVGRAVLVPVGMALGIAVVASGYWTRFVKKAIDLRGRRLVVDEDIGTKYHEPTRR